MANGRRGNDLPHLRFIQPADGTADRRTPCTDPRPTHGCWPRVWRFWAYMRQTRCDRVVIWERKRGNVGEDRHVSANGPLGQAGQPPARRHPGMIRLRATVGTGQTTLAASRIGKAMPRRKGRRRRATISRSSPIATTATTAAAQALRRAITAAAAMPAPDWGGQQPDPRGYDLGSYMPPAVPSSMRRRIRRRSRRVRHQVLTQQQGYGDAERRI